jgi:hypothetical protein
MWKTPNQCQGSWNENRTAIRTGAGTGIPFASTAMDLPIVRGLFTGARDSLTN